MIVVGGECLIDMIEFDGEGGQSFFALPGGSPFNVALAAGRLGLPVSFLSRQSTDEFGRRLSAALEESKVDTSLCPVTGQPSTLAIAGLDPESGGVRYMFYTEGTAGVSMQEDELPPALPAEVQAVHVGSFSLTMEPIASALEALVRREAQERVITIDPNIRTMLIRDPESARERLRALLPQADIIKLSDEDLEWLEPGVDEEEFAFEKIGQGTSLVLITRGGGGGLGKGSIWQLRSAGGRDRDGRFHRGRRHLHGRDSDLAGRERSPLKGELERSLRRSNGELAFLRRARRRNHLHAARL